MRRAGALLAALAAALFACAGAGPAAAQAVSRDDIITQLNHLDNAPTLDLPALRTQTQERSRLRGRNEPPPQKRPPIAPDLMSLPALNVDIQFDVDTPIVRPESYQTVGRIADAMVNSALLPYSFLVVGHIEANGKREANVTLSQRRADAIRDILVNTFKISAKRLQSIGLGEEQLLDPARPTAPVNQQIQIITIAKAPEETAAPAAVPSKPAPAAAKKQKRHK
ncbi:MAG: OmpA family protein [Bradyrhizobium sp.]|jgi:OmpA-OmpF porin, OOP family|uniref:OmpA family protein n=1 Tax=Bradyrhizobium sp. TaxID=376 RepID=UPI003C799D09